MNAPSKHTVTKFLYHNDIDMIDDVDRPTWNIAHRGASYHLPEHTLAAYRLAWELNADYIELDLVVSSDGILVAMHDIDLTITSNIIMMEDRNTTYNAVYINNNTTIQNNDDNKNQQSRQKLRKWYSPTKHQSSYWSFNFTHPELMELRVRQRLPEQRSTEYDDLFGIPTLRDIATHLVEWNHQLLLNTNTSSTTTINNDTKPSGGNIRKRPAGLYVEIKDSDWILHDTGMDVVELLYQEVTTHQYDDNEQDNPWNTILYQGQPKTTNGDPDSGSYTNAAAVVPGLIVQSFNGYDLERFHTLWQTEWAANANTTTTTATSTQPRPPEPLYVLLVDEHTCTREEFWFNVGQHYRSFLFAIGCAVSCLDHFAVRERLLSYHLPVHPWTLRPEDVPNQFVSLSEQIEYLVCNTSGIVQGIFIETPEMVLPKLSDCPPTQPIRSIPTTSPIGNNALSQSGVIVASFLLGMAVTALLLTTFGMLRSKQQRQHVPVPTSDPSSRSRSSSLELT